MTRDNRKRLALYARAEIEVRIQFPTIGGAEFAHIFGVALDPTVIADLRVSLSLAKLGGGLWSGQVGRTIKLPTAVATIYEATKQLNAEYPMRSFTPDVHLVGHLGEVIAAKEFKLTLLADSHPGHDAKDKAGRYVQIKLTAKNSISMYANCDRLIVMQIKSPEYAELICDGDGAPIWAKAGKPQKNGQRKIGLSAIRRISELHS